MRRVPTRAALVLALVLATVLSSCGGSAPAPGRDARAGRSSAVPSADSVRTGFEDGGLAAFPDATSARVGHGAAHTGSFGLDVDARGASAYVRWVPRPGRPWWSFRAWVRIVSWTRAESVDVFTVRNGNVVNNFDLFVDTPRRSFRWDLYRGDTAHARRTVRIGRWYLVEATGSFATDTYRADVRIDGVDQPGISSHGQRPSTVQDLVLGPGGTTKTNRIQFDDVEFQVSSHPLGYLPESGSK
jgi:hypothetical protein